MEVILKLVSFGLVGGFDLGIEMDGREEDVPIVVVEGKSLDEGAVLNKGDVPGIVSGVQNLSVDHSEWSDLPLETGYSGKISPRS